MILPTTLGNVPKRFRDATIASWRERTGSNAVADVLDSYVADIDNEYEAGRGLLLIGRPGVGKTYLTCAVLNALPSRFTRRFYPLNVLMRMSLRLMDLKDQWMRFEDEDAYTEWKRGGAEMRYVRNNCDFLALDDVGMEHRTNSNWVEDEFQLLVRMRYDACLPTIITSNMPVEQWGSVYGAAMASFVHEAYRIVVVRNVDDLRIS